VRAWLLVLLAGAGSADAQGLLAPLEGPGTMPPPPWREVLLPKQTLPKTRFELVDIDGTRALRIESPASYGTLVHALDAPRAAVPVLSWRWRLDRAVAGADLRQKAGDDAAVKVCVMFDHALDRVPFVERQQLRLARLLSGEPLPAATLCYAWDRLLPAGSVLPNAYTGRMRWMVLQGQGSPLGEWRSEQRDLRTDFLKAFGDEATELPRISAVLVGADADNSGGHGLAHVAGLVLK
jgi:Protein of unknown function (DUF3047)